MKKEIINCALVAGFVVVPTVESMHLNERKEFMHHQHTHEVHETMPQGRAITIAKSTSGSSVSISGFST